MKCPSTKKLDTKLLLKTQSLMTILSMQSLDWTSQNELNLRIGDNQSNSVCTKDASFLFSSCMDETPPKRRADQATRRPLFTKNSSRCLLNH